MRRSATAILGAALLLLAIPAVAWYGPDPWHLAGTNGGGGSGTVTSVGLTVPSWLSVAGSPVTTSGTLAVSAVTQLANLIFAGPASGAAAAPTFRALVAADIPASIDSDTTGNAGTATALAADGTDCGAGEAAAGVDASGNAEGCFAPSGAAPAGTGSELQFRSDATTFGAVTGSSVSGANVTLGGTLSGATQLTVDNLRLDGNTLSSTDANGNVLLTPNGTGQVGIPAGSASVPGLAFTAALGRGIYAANGGTHFSISSASAVGIDANGDLLIKDTSVLGWSTSTPDATGADAGFDSPGAGTMRVNSGNSASAAGWLRWAGECRVASDQTNDTTTPASSTCSITLLTGRKYGGICRLALADSVAADGAALDFDGGTATASAFRAHCTAFDSALALSAQRSTLAGDFAATTLTGDGMMECHVINLETSGAGTFIPRFWQNAHTTGTLTLYQGSHCLLWDIP